MAKAAAASASASSDGAASKTGGDAGKTGGDGGATKTGGDGTGDGKTGGETSGEGAGGKTGDEAAAAGKTGGDGKAGGDGTGDGKKGGKGDEAGASGAPEKYSLKVPDGGHIDKTDLPRIEKMAREANWTNEETQAYLEELNTSMQATSAEFLANLKADPDLGGDKLAETQRLANLAIEKLRPEGHARRDGFMRLLNRGGYINHPEVVGLFADIGKLFDEDGHIGGLPARAGTKTTAQKMYDHPTSVAADKAGS